MKTNIFIPEKIKVGFQNREGTYTKKLAYVIYYDQKGTLRKEASWNSWRDKKIQDLDFENVPTSGFVLNKKAGGYSTGWNHRQTYVRVYDPRDFEFEISVPNLLYILENTNSIKGKGLEGEFVYGWDGTDLVLIPTESPDYVEISQFNKILYEKNYIKSKDLILGATYKTKDNQNWVYMGRYDYYRYGNENKGKHYFFYLASRSYSQFEAIKSLGDKIISVVSEDCIDNYAGIMDKLECSTMYSPYDESKDEYVQYELESFVKKCGSVGSHWYGETVYLENNKDGAASIRKSRIDDGKFIVVIQKRVKSNHYWGRDEYYNQDYTVFEGMLEEIYSNFKPMYKNKYLANGKLYQKGDE